MKEVFIIKIFLDDIREIDSNKYGYNRVYTYSDCITLVDSFKGDLEFISLDYHLGPTSEHTGLDVLVYMYENGVHPNHINIHSDHYIGAPKMVTYAETHFNNTVITSNEIK